MTWNTESIFSAAIKRRKHVEQSGALSRKILKSRRPSERHRVSTRKKASHKSKFYSPSKMKPKLSCVEVSLEVSDKGEKEVTSSSLKANIIRYCERFSNGLARRKTLNLQEKNEETAEIVTSIVSSNKEADLNENSCRLTMEQSIAHSASRHSQFEHDNSQEISKAPLQSYSWPHITSMRTESESPKMENVADERIGGSDSFEACYSAAESCKFRRMSWSRRNVRSKCDLGPAIAVMKDVVPAFGTDPSPCDDISQTVACCAPDSHEATMSECGADVGPGISVIVDNNPTLSGRDIGPDITAIPDLDYEENGTVRMSHSTSKRIKQYPEKSHRLHYSCLKHSSESSLNESDVCQQIVQPKAQDESCSYDVDTSHEQISHCRDAVTSELHVAKQSLRRRKTASRNINKFTLRSTNLVSESHPVSSMQQSSVRADWERETSATKDSSHNIKQDEILLKDIEVEVQSIEDLRTLDSHFSLDTESGASALEHCVQQESPSQPTQPSPRRTIHYASRARRTRCRKVRVCIHRRPKKILVIGDMTTGKTNLISAYSRDRFTDNYIPTILNCHQTDAKIFGELIDLVVMEISGRDDFQPLRRRAYHKADAAIVCYSVDSLLSLERIYNFWVPELKKYAPKVPFVVVGTKRDLRDQARDKLEDELALCAAEGKESVDGDDEQTGERHLALMATRLRGESDFREKYVSKERGRSLAERVGAGGFVECSSLYRDSTREVFETTTKVALRKRRKRKADNRSFDAACTIL